jgi:hypothetical protein
MSIQGPETIVQPHAVVPPDAIRPPRPSSFLKGIHHSAKSDISRKAYTAPKISSPDAWRAAQQRNRSLPEAHEAPWPIFDQPIALSIAQSSSSRFGGVSKSPWLLREMEFAMERSGVDKARSKMGMRRSKLQYNCLAPPLPPRSLVAGGALRRGHDCRQPFENKCR